MSTSDPVGCGLFGIDAPTAVHCGLGGGGTATIVAGTTGASVLARTDFVVQFAIGTVSATPVPEPSTVLFLTTGLIGLAVLTRRERKR